VFCPTTAGGVQAKSALAYYVGAVRVVGLGGAAGSVRCAGG
jgi:hypothetical protein